MGYRYSKRGHRKELFGKELIFIEKLLWLKTRGRCLYCKKRITFSQFATTEFYAIKDHYIPLCKGGADDHSNLMPSCKRCDNIKGGDLPTRTTIRRILKIRIEDVKKEQADKQRRSNESVQTDLRGSDQSLGPSAPSVTGARSEISEGAKDIQICPQQFLNEGENSSFK